MLISINQAYRFSTSVRLSLAKTTLNSQAGKQLAISAVLLAINKISN